MVNARDAQALLDKLESGEQLPDDDRRTVLSYLLFARGELLPPAEFGRLLNVDVALVERDISALKRELAETYGYNPEDAELVFHVLVEIAAIDRYIGENHDRLRPSELAALLKERREAMLSVRDRLARRGGWE